jgi:hypothetical protein
MQEDIRVERGWIALNATRGDDGRLVTGTGGEVRLNPVEALSERDVVPMGAILKASVQRLAFWRTTHGG